jgi:hypothetical protein
MLFRFAGSARAEEDTEYDYESGLIHESLLAS